MIEPAVAVISSLAHTQQAVIWPGRAYLVLEPIPGRSATPEKKQDMTYAQHGR